MNPNDDTQNIIGLDENAKNEMGPEGMGQPITESLARAAIIEKPSGGSQQTQTKEPLPIINPRQDLEDAAKLEEIRREIGTQGNSTKREESLEVVGPRLELRDVFDPSSSTLGHGTSQERAQQILEQGLRAKQPDLYSTTVPLFDGSKPFEDQEAQVVDKISHWPHRDAKAVVVVMIPNPQEGEIGGSRYFNSVFQELPESDTGYNDRYLIPPNYIKGYVDVETQNFIPNPKFQPEKPTVVTKGIMPRVGEPTGPVDIPKAPSSDNNIPEIW